MKMRWLSLLLAAFLLVAPTLSADDGSSEGWLGDLIEQIVSLVLGDVDEVSHHYPPGGATLNGNGMEGSLNYPPSGSALNGDEDEFTQLYPPGG